MRKFGTRPGPPLFPRIHKGAPSISLRGSIDKLAKITSGEGIIVEWDHGILARIIVDGKFAKLAADR